MIVRTDQSLLSQALHNLQQILTIETNGCFQCVSSVCVCVLWCLCFLEQQRSDLAMHILSSVPCSCSTYQPLEPMYSVFAYMLLLNIHVPLTSCLSSLTSNYFDILKPAESMLIRSSTSATAVLSDKAPRALRSAGGGGGWSAARHFLAVGNRAPPTSWVMRGAEVP